MSTTTDTFKEEQLALYLESTRFCKPDKHIWVWASNATVPDEPAKTSFVAAVNIPGRIDGIL